MLISKYLRTRIILNYPTSPIKGTFLKIKQEIIRKKIRVPLQIRLSLFRFEQSFSFRT